MGRIKAAKQYINKSKLLGREEFTIDIESEDKIKLLKYTVPSERTTESIVKVTIPDFITHIGYKAFSGVSKGLKELKLGSFGTSNVTDMYGMFNGCRLLDSEICKIVR